MFLFPSQKYFPCVTCSHFPGAWFSAQASWDLLFPNLPSNPLFSSHQGSSDTSIQERRRKGNPSRLQHSIAGPQQFCDCSHIMASSSQSIHAITWQGRCYGTPDAGDEEICLDHLKTITHHQYLHPVWSEVFFKNPFLIVRSQPLRGRSGLP